jgi:isocitrate dehydrogenase kinase/phosphatase
MHEPDVERAADIILGGFLELRDLFRSITRRAVGRFERRDWDGIRRDTSRRLVLHTRLVAETLADVRSAFGSRVDDQEFWASLKIAYGEEIVGTNDSELAQTFFNSLTRQVFSHIGIDGSMDFLTPDFPLPFGGWEMSAARMYGAREITPGLLRKILTDARFHIDFEDLADASTRAARALTAAIERQLGKGTDFEALDFLERPFIRNKAAYLVGRLRDKDQTLMPVVIALLNPEGRLLLDAVVTTEDDASVIFSFARWYFHVDIESPRKVIGFLHSILPRKRISELYIALGYHKHGKTTFYGDLVQQIRDREEQFVQAPGQKGMVMAVFTLPSYEFVFKVIRDRFPPNKDTTATKVKQRYDQVLMRDRVGRLVDYQEFEHLEIGVEKFSQPVIDELLSETSRTVQRIGDRLQIQHVYIGRRVTPLDIYLRTAPMQARIEAVIDWGNAIKDLAAANVFAGDMLQKNFGVTRHGRVVFYDYDELSLLEECRFRKIPPARFPEEELSPEPYFSVSPGDIFPEELKNFLGLEEPLEQIFLEHHRDLLSTEFWLNTQERAGRGELLDVIPYRRTI